jgi:putative intracellular protease/amidase
MLKEINQTVAAVCTATATTAQALNDGAAILRIKGAAAKHISAIEAVKSISEAKSECSKDEIDQALNLLAELGV